MVLYQNFYGNLPNFNQIADLIYQVVKRNIAYGFNRQILDLTKKIYLQYADYIHFRIIFA